MTSRKRSRRKSPVSVVEFYPEIKRKYRKGGTYRSIAAEYGCCFTAIQKALAVMKVKPRPRGHKPGDNGWGGRSRAEVLEAAARKRV